MKRVLTIIMGLMLVTGINIDAMAVPADSQPLTDLEKAEYLNQQGVFEGTSGQTFEPDLESRINAEQAIKLIGKALKWEVDPAATTDFVDVSAWAIPYVEYARLNGITTGVSADKFGADYITGQRAITWLLAACYLDKEAVWEETQAYAKEYELADWMKQDLTRGDMVHIIYQALAPESKIQALIKNTGYTKQYVMIPNGDYQIPAVVTLPKTKSDQKVPLVVMCHGTGSNKDEAGNGYKILAPKLAQAGIGSIRFDFIGTGDSTVDYIKYSLQSAVRDTNRVAAYAAQLTMVDADKIGVMGWSQGGTVALLAAAENPKLKTVVTWAGAVDLSGLITEAGYKQAQEQGYSVLEFGWRSSLKLGLEWYQDVKTTDVLKEFAKSKAPVLAINGAEDKVVNPKNADLIVKASTNSKSKTEIMAQADHTFKIFSGDMTVFNQLCDTTVSWFEQTLK